MKRCIAILLISTLGLQAQDESPWQLTGYLKHLASNSRVNQDYFPEDARESMDFNSFDQQLHNRFDLKYFKGSWTGAIGMRNRLFQGASPGLGAAFTNALDDDPGLVDLSLVYWQNDEVILHTILDRLWLQYERERWNIRLGRQRINWGMTSIFNPNDLLNQYNFLDFDYEERPGADALRVQFFPDHFSQLEMALSMTNDQLQTAAILYRNNAYRYDFQIVTAYYDEQFTTGGAWAGSIGGLGFKGEANYYFENENQPAVLVAATDLDYVFRNGIYLSLGYLFNQTAPEDLGVTAFSDLSAGQVLSPRNPYIYRNTGVLSLNYPFNPLISGTLTGMYSTSANSTIIFPSISYSLSTNWDLLLAGQFFLSDNELDENKFGLFANAIFTRLKWSF